MKKGRILKTIVKSLLFGVISVVLVTLGIDAADHYDNLSESLVGRVMGGEEGVCPEGMTLIPTEKGGFCIDIYEASASEKCPFENAGNQSQTQENLNSQGCEAVSEPGKEPWRYISQAQAMTACAKAGKRLPSNEEWYQASLGTPDLSVDWSKDDCQVNSNWPNQPGLTGSGQDCQSAYGVHDMIGNVWEWVRAQAENGLIDGKEMPDSGFVSAVDSEGLVRESDPENPDANHNNDYLWIKDTSVRGVARGGYWDNKADAGVYAMYIVPPLDFAGTGIGFRCVK